mmetsp:Transcript_34235/g.94575  ORF Transcript_34235/g.94575 Transcript_34235/m.94575 type:complete len:85 (+) Transcript_34235:5-259(+)
METKAFSAEQLLLMLPDTILHTCDQFFVSCSGASDAAVGICKGIRHRTACRRAARVRFYPPQLSAVGGCNRMGVYGPTVPHKGA